MPLFVFYFYCFIRALTFAGYALDKQAAKHRRRRIAEATPRIFSLIGGWPGALLAQKMFRHKTRKRSFRAGFYITVVVNILVLMMTTRYLAAA